MSDAPALFKWIRSRHPGVSRRQRSSSGMGVRVGVIIARESSWEGTRDSSGLSARELTEYGTAPYLLHQVLEHKPHIRRSLGEPAHVPREPVCPVADQDPHRHPLTLERALLGGAMRPTSCVPNTARASPWAARSSSCPASTA